MTIFRSKFNINLFDNYRKIIEKTIYRLNKSRLEFSIIFGLKNLICRMTPPNFISKNNRIRASLLLKPNSVTLHLSLRCPGPEVHMGTSSRASSRSHIVIYRVTVNAIKLLIYSATARISFFIEMICKWEHLQTVFIFRFN